MHRLLLWCLLAVPAIGSAAPITYSFTVDGGSFGPLAGMTSPGSFTFDSSIIPAGGTGIVDQADLLSDFSLLWGGATYTESEVNSGRLSFSGGSLSSGAFGTSCSAGACAVFPLPLDGLFLSVGAVNFVAYNVDGMTLFGATSLGASATEVPEPGPLALLGLGLVALALIARRRAS